MQVPDKEKPRRSAPRGGELASLDRLRNEGVIVRNLSRKRRVIGGAITLLVLGIVGLVYAAWTTTGSGSGYAKAGSSSALSTVDVSASTTATLFPGTSGDVLIKFSNPNPFPVQVTSVSLNGTNADIAADASHSGCTTTGVS